MKPPMNNETVPMTRRYPNLKRKQLKRDDKIARRLILAWDRDQDQASVFLIFMKNKELLSDYRYWEILRTVWIICGSVERSDTFRKLMKANRKNRHYFSTPEEQKELNKLPDNFMVYRAANDINDGGISWTLSLDYAIWYMKEYSKAHVFEMYVNRLEVFALINRNKESEVLIFEKNNSVVEFPFTV